MLKLKIIGSSSKGNCYILQSNTTSIMLDCGCKKIIDEDLNKIDGIILTHRHLDHCGAIPKIKDLYKNKYYANKDTLDVLPILNKDKIEVVSGEKFQIKDFSLVPFELLHDVPCYGFLIKDNISKCKFLYVTDTGMIDYEFKDIDFFLIESNCDEDLLTYEDYKEVRLYDTHLSMQQTANFLNKNINHNTKKIILGHISKGEKDYKKHERYVLGTLKDKNIEVLAINPILEKVSEIVLKQDLEGFDFD